MSQKVLITGITGQDGAYLSQFLIEKGYEVYGMTRAKNEENMWRLRELGVQEKISIVEGHLENQEEINNLIQEIQPDEIYNLAGRSFVGKSWSEPIETADINAIGTLRLLEAMRHYSPKAKFYQASTSEMYGNNHNQNQQDETTPLHPRSPYAISKLFAHWMTINYRESYGLFACSGIMFNHESPLRGIDFVTRKISDGVARIKLGLAESITLGNIDAKRDWGFAGDYIKVMWLMLQQDTPEEFVVSTGVTHSVKDFLRLAFREIGIEEWESYTRFDPAFMRPVEVEELSGKNNKAKEILGWQPEVCFEELVHIMVKRDIERLSA